MIWYNHKCIKIGEAAFLVRRLLCIMLAAMLAFCFFSCGKEQGAEEIFALAMDEIKAFDLRDFAEHIAESSASYFDFAVSREKTLSSYGKEALAALYAGISYEITGVGDGFLDVKINSFDFAKITRYVENSYALGTGGSRAEILASLLKSESFSSVYGKTYEIKVKFASEAGKVKFFFDSAENYDFVTSLGLAEMINLMAK